MELVRMRDIPPRECAVNRGGDLPEGVGGAYQKIATGRLGHRLAGLPNEDDAEDQPTTHVRMALGGRFARRAHRALRPPLDHSQNSSRVISGSRIRRLSACGQKLCEGWQWTATLLPERLVTFSCGDPSPCRSVAKNF